MAMFIRPIATFLTSVLGPNAYTTGSEASSQASSSELADSPTQAWYDARQTASPSPKGLRNVPSAAAREDDFLQGRKTTELHGTSTNRKTRELQEPSKFVAALQRAAELWSVLCAVDTEADDLELETRQEISEFDLQTVEFTRLSVKRGGEFLDFRLRSLAHDIKTMKDDLEGGDSRLARLHRARTKKTQVAADLKDIISRILQASQLHIDASRSTGYIGNLKVTVAFCQRMIKVRECAYQLEELRIQQDAALRHYASILRLADAAKAAKNTSADSQQPVQGDGRSIKDIEASRIAAKSEFEASKSLLEIRNANQLDRRDKWLGNIFISALRDSQLLSSMCMGDLSPLRQNFEPANTQTQIYHPLQEEFLVRRTELERHINRLEEFKMQHHLEHVRWLYTYRESNEDDWQAETRRRYGKPYDDWCVDGQCYIDAARQELNNAMNRLVEAGIVVPPSPAFEEEEENPPPSTTLRRRIRKHQRGVSRGDLDPLPATPPPIPTGSSVRDLQSNDSHGFPFKDVIEEMKKKWHPQQQDLRLQTMKERRRKGREVWVGRMKYSKRGWNLKSPTADRNKAASKTYPHE
ncbi:hypothetical protein M409DRAFT_60263 [Zasmidium cellare ATCC 36951]|uniref:Uncharacterized protein n=1 Tax=Zasmidium cellare ATCC 36951 TaxID=1080233 RepID=A0A6A6C1X1_ZASCE|nr:uncharacterized protein M409DRAFT_60263 [Zasmidium cellare ATCC 36951]KAF2160160.1 hypothetical protein M409DRAFT_60263 [Zasmidium cellare ATCC 36951]